LIKAQPKHFTAYGGHVLNQVRRFFMRELVTPPPPADKLWGL